MRRASSGSFTVQIQRATDPDAAETALHRVRDDLYATPHPDEPREAAPSFVAVDSEAEGGPTITFDMHDLDHLMPTVLQYVRDRLAEAGVRDALISWPDDPKESWRLTARQQWSADVAGQSPGWFRVARGRLVPDESLRDRIPRHETLRAAILRLYPVAPAAPPKVLPEVDLPASWLDFAAGWISRGAGRGDKLWASHNQTSELFQLSVRDSHTYLATQMTSPPRLAHLVAGDIARTVRGCACFAGQYPSLCFAAGGPTSTDVELVNHAHELVTAARALSSEVGYAVLGLRPDFGAYWDNPAYWARGVQWPAATYRLPLSSVTKDGYVYDAFYYQILGADHLGRLGSRAGGFQPLSDGKSELFVQTPESWLPGSAELDLVQQEGRRLLRPCIPSDDAVEQIIRSYY